jgi:hypothetical protein
MVEKAIKVFKVQLDLKVLKVYRVFKVIKANKV